MKLLRLLIFYSLPAAAVVMLYGCAAGPYASDVRLNTAYRSIPGVPFSYLLPEGWFDASPGADSTRFRVWLIRSDYGASISVQEIGVDQEARLHIERSGVRTLAELDLALARSAPSTIVLSPLEEFSSGGREFYTYELVNVNSGDTTRTAVFDADGRTFEVNAVAVARNSRSTRAAVFSVQQRFLEALRW